MGGGGWGSHCVTPRYLHGPLQMFGPENGVSNYLALVRIMARLVILRVC